MPRPTTDDASMKLDFRAIRESIRAGKASPRWLASWVPSTYAAPEAFKTALYAYAASRPDASLRSSPSTGFDFYHDCVLAHGGRHRRAVVAKEGRELGELSFDALHVRCSALAAAWSREGVEPGQTIAVVLPVGISFTVALLTALRLGVVVSIVPPLGRTFVRTRLLALSPDRIVADAAGAQLAGIAERDALPTHATGREVAGAVHHRYEPGDVVARLFSPLVGGGAEPFELTADVLHASLLRDAMLVYALESSDVLSAPGFSVMQHHPPLLLTTLLAGACFAEVAVKDLDADPKLLERLGVTMLGVSRPLRDRLLSFGVRAGTFSRRAFRSVTDTQDFGPWQDFAALCTSHDMQCFDVLANAPTGGAMLASAPSQQAPQAILWPVPGQTWQLSEIGGGTVPALGASGVFTVLRDDADDPSMPRVVLAETSDGWLFSGPMERGPSGTSYPVEEVARVVETHSEVAAASVVLVPGRWLNDARVVLLAFVDGTPTRGTSVLASELEALLEREMGEGVRPDRVEVYPLRPRYVEGAVDHAWCRSEYLSGSLGRKAKSELFVTLSRLGWIVGAPNTKPLGGEG
jgi:hypothetical protein